jgi:hypothetical protein
MRWRGMPNIPKSHVSLPYPPSTLDLCQLIDTRAFRRGGHAILAGIYTAYRFVLVVSQQFC